MEKSFKDVPAWEDDFAMDEIIDKNTWSMENHLESFQWWKNRSRGKTSSRKWSLVCDLA